VQTCVLHPVSRNGPHGPHPPVLTGAGQGGPIAPTRLNTTTACECIHAVVELVQELLHTLSALRMRDVHPL